MTGAVAGVASPHPSSSGAERAVITLALGKPYYTELAVNLARSFLQWHDGGGGAEIDFHLITNHPELVPPDLARIRVRAARPGEFGEGFTTKLHLDRLAPAPRTLFVDADCLVTRPLDEVFRRFAGRPVGVTGRVIADGEFFCDVAAVRDRLGVPGMIQFVGGIYYLEPGPACSAVFDTARRIAERYDELGFVRLRGLPNEEPLLSAAMMLHGLAPLPDDGTVKGDAMCYPSAIDVDIFRGEARMVNDPRDPGHFRKWPATEARPIIVHFNCSFAERDPYLREVERLRRVRGDRWPLLVATLYAWMTKTLPLAVVRELKRLLRPAYHRLFGVRPIAPSPRM